MASPLANAIEFFRSFGFFDIVLPFLLVFTVVFAVLEKSRILGEEEGKSRKNLNTMVAFVIALLVVATNKIVTALNIALPNIILLLVVFVSFLMLVGLFSKTGELEFRTLHKGWYNFFLVIIFIAVVLIFLSAIRLESGKSWLEYAFDYVIERWSGTVVSSIIFLAVMIGAILFITKSSKREEKV